MQVGLAQCVNKGMQRDYSMDKASQEFAYENRNIRITTTGNESFLSVTNEKSTEQIALYPKLPDDILVLGSAIINDILVLFCKGDKDYIYKMTINDLSGTVVLLYEGDLNFNVENPIECITSYESDEILKVYWVDGHNQPRCINVFPDTTYEKNIFDFTPSAIEDVDVIIEKEYKGIGTFQSGVIQYFISLYNKHHSETNIIYESPLYYISPNDRGGKLNETQTCNFKITINTNAQLFSNAKVYSIIRTSLNVLQAFEVADVDIKNNNIVIDTNNGVPIDPSSLLFSSNIISAGTIEQKDQTLFLGDIKEYKETLDIKSIRESIEACRTETDRNITDSNLEKHLPDTYLKYKWKVIGYNNSELNSQYKYFNQLNYSSDKIKGFKSNELYIFGIQFFNGEWSATVPLDELVCDKYPKTLTNIEDIKDDDDYTFLGDCKEVNYDTYLCLPYIYFNPGDLFSNLKEETKYRLVVADRLTSEKSIVCQGYVNPTLYNERLGYLNSWITRTTNVKRHGDNVLGVNTYRPSVSTEIDLSAYASDEIQQTAFISSPETNIWNITNIKIVIYYDYATQYKMTLIFTLVGGNDTFDKEFNFTIWGEPFAFKNLYWKDYHYNRSVGDKTIYTALLDEIKKLDSDITEIANIKETDAIFYSPEEIPTILGSDGKYTNIVSRPLNDEIEGTLVYPSDNHYFINANLVTLNAPNIDEIKNYLSTDLKFRIIGASKVANNVSNYTITADDNVYNGNKEQTISVDLLGNYNLNTDNTGLKSFPLWEGVPGDDLSHRYVWTYLWNKDNLSGVGTPASTIKIKTFANVFVGNTYYYNSNSIWKPYYGIDICNYVDGESYVNDDKIFHNNVEDVIPITNVQSFYVTGYPTVDNLDNLSIENYPNKAYTSNIKINYSSENNILVRFKSEEQAVVLPAFIPNADNVDTLNKRFKDIILDKNYPTQKIGVCVDVGDVKLTGLINNQIYRIYDNDYLYKRLNKLDYLLIYDDEYAYDYYVCRVLEKGITNVSQQKYLEIVKLESVRSDNHSDVLIHFDVLYDKIKTSTLLFGSTDSDPYIKILVQSIVGTNNNGCQNMIGFSYHNSYTKTGVSDSIGFSHNLYIAELYKDLKDIISYDTPNYENYTFLPISSSTKVTSDCHGLEGDTYFQRWDSLRTYPTNEESQSVVDVVSLDLESYINLDGRSDVNRGRLDVYNIRPNNISETINDVYSQSNNFITSSVLDEKFDDATHPTLYTWSLTKQGIEDIDTWTSINLSRSAKLDGDKGVLTKIKKWNNQLLAFQEKGLAVINYNQQTAISNQEGVPIEIAASGLVSGHYYLSSTQGCKNKWSIVDSPYGIYFIDSYNKSINVFDSEGIKSLSTINLFQDWILENEKTAVWNPLEGNEGFKSFYDPIHKEVYFVNNEEALCYNELLSQFTSFYDYKKLNTMVPINGYIYGIKDVKIHRMFEGTNYCNLFGTSTGYSMTYKINKDPFIDKTWTNIEYRADIFNSGNINNDSNKTLETFDSLEVWNEYQKGKSDMSKAKCKFRIWRNDVPRNTTAKSQREKLDRIRNPWIMLKLTKETNTNVRMEFHDLLVKYLQ